MYRGATEGSCESCAEPEGIEGTVAFPLVPDPALANCCASAKTFVGRPSISSDEIEDRAPEEAFVLVSEASDGTELEPLKVDPEAEGPTGTLGSADEGDPVRVEAAIGAETLLV
jgi:hypothetical protein